MASETRNGMMCDTLEEANSLPSYWGGGETPMTLSMEEVALLTTGCVLWTTDGEYVTLIAFEQEGN